ncbi:TonB-dependent receptor [Aquimarina sp. AD1]|uniref:TonB-dependent receptor n=1 Tax=Aquimarina sp. (strain AD1) TaxID=1714848 RepID=UPI000E483612|nr:TonB-dependent receptor [Aquimarina sp. AD1]AXT56709.1 TonB-dependent receptor [Aquimarina sp. AD1]RKN22711.1 TonB-dependent receptor [Aquimarina sp. AD1]
MLQSVVILKRKNSVFLMLLITLFCQSQEAIKGVIVDQNSNPIPEAAIQVVELENVGVITNFDGEFTLSLPEGTYTLKTSFIGFQTRFYKITTNASKEQYIRIVLKQNVEELNDVIVKGKTAAQKVKEKAFEVEVIETKGLKNSSVDINAILTTIPGVNVRQRGGLGAAFDFSLNGLSGKQVKFFIDGIPIENFGSSLSLNNFPATLVERAEVFKGVVPIHLGADALGGAVNIITNQRKKDFLDVSYDIGSFNTHRATINGQHYNKNGWMFQLSSFYNYSDNNYTIDDIDVRDELGNDTGIRRDNVERFHDAYNSQMIRIQTGLVDRSYADRLILGFTASANENEIQHPIDPQNPFGEVFTENDIISGSIEFEKNNLFNEKLKLKIYGALTENNERVVDTSSRKYDWFGNFIERGDQTLGEFEASKTLFKFKDNLHLINALATYTFNDVHSLSANYTKNYIRRRGEDDARTGRIAFRDPHIVNKNILGLSYDIDLLDTRWRTSFFSKGYLLNSEGILEDLFTNVEEDRFTRFENTFEELGYGFATTYKILDNFQIKGSFEKTFRIPEGYEVFGDGFLLKSNPALLPEESYNANLGALFNTDINGLKLQIDTNVFFRESENFIAIRSEGIFSRYFNTADARSTGVEGEIRMLYDAFFLDLNATYQNIIDRNAGENAGVDFLKNQRIANIPYVFGNARIGGKFNNVLAVNDQLNVSWNTYYVHDYPLTSFVEGNPEDRDIIPEQISHNVELGYSFNEGRYNIAVSARNILDAKIYDNFEIQQPGRAFYVKLRYYISN